MLQSQWMRRPSSSLRAFPQQNLWAPPHCIFSTLSWPSLLSFFPVSSMSFPGSFPLANKNALCCCLVSKLSDSLWPDGLHHARLLCPPLSPRVCSSSCPLNRWCYLTISFSASPLLLLPSIFPNIRIFLNELALLIRFLSTGASASPSVFPMTTQGWFPLGLTGLISLQFKGLSRVFSSTTIWKHQFFSAQPSLQSFSDPLVASSQKSYLHTLSPLTSHSLLNSLQVGSKMRFLPLQ